MKFAIWMVSLGMICSLAGCGSDRRSQEPIPLAVAGRKIAESICDGCHDVSLESRARPERQPSVPTAFAVIAADRRVDLRRLTQFVRFPHGEMDNVVLTREDTDAVVAYILSLKRD